VGLVDFTHAANRGVLRYLADPARLARSVSVAAKQPECLASDVPRPYETLGTHPDLVSRLWGQLGGRLPVDCRVIVHGSPALVRPDSGVIFGFAGGTLMYALRLPLDIKPLALAAGAKTIFRYPAYPALGIQESVLDLHDVGDEWVFGCWHDGEREWCTSAYAHAV
jgi:hypothetical protein